nr:hypothetical protein L203_01521 [Cryptococcus depauperatus CBS 7841]
MVGIVCALPPRAGRGICAGRLVLVRRVSPSGAMISGAAFTHVEGGYWGEGWPRQELKGTNGSSEVDPLLGGIRTEARVGGAYPTRPAVSVVGQPSTMPDQEKMAGAASLGGEAGWAVVAESSQGYRTGLSVGNTARMEGVGWMHCGREAQLQSSVQSQRHNTPATLVTQPWQHSRDNSDAVVVGATFYRLEMQSEQERISVLKGIDHDASTTYTDSRNVGQHTWMAWNVAMGLSRHSEPPR